MTRSGTVRRLLLRISLVSALILTSIFVSTGARTASAALPGVANLHIAQTDSPDPIYARETLLYTLSVENYGPDTAGNVTVIDTLPVDAGLIAASGVDWSCTDLGDGSVSCTIDSLPVGSAPTLYVSVVAPPEGGFIFNQASISSDDTDPDTADNFSSETTLVQVRPVVAEDDSGSIASGVSGGEAIADVLANDTYDGAPATLEDVSITPRSGDPELTIEPDTGAVNVSPGTAEGDYALEYRICELATSNCDDAVVRVAVAVAELDASPDLGSIDDGSSGGEAVADVLANDIYEGSAATLSDVSLTQQAHDLALTLNTSSGAVSVEPATAAGEYTLYYEICDLLDPANCDSTGVTVDVEPIEAAADSAEVQWGMGGIAIDDVLDNDTFAGAPATLSTVSIGIVGGDPELTLDTDTGAVSVDPSAGAGRHWLEYEICSLTDPLWCSQADVSVDVVEISALDDHTDYWVVGLHGGKVIENVLANDTLDSLTPALADVILTQLPGGDSELTLDTATGSVAVAPGTPSDGYYQYSLEYQICDQAHPTFCASAWVYAQVDPASISAEDDSGSVSNGLEESVAIANVLENDRFDGGTATLSSVTLDEDWGDDATWLDESTGAVYVESGTPAGTYYLDYEICDRIDEFNCAYATAIVEVGSVEIAADDDYGSVANGAHESVAIANVLENDYYDGSTATLSDVYLWEDSSDSELWLDESSGEVYVEAGAPAGTYYLDYEICDRIDEFNCAYATAEVEVGSVEIEAEDDYGSVSSGASGGVAVDDVLANDTYDGSTPTLSDVSLSQFDGDAELALDTATGSVSVEAGTALGDYFLYYEICDLIDSGNCSWAEVRVHVGVAEITANDDSGSVPSASGGQAIANVVSNDTLDGVAATLATVSVSYIGGDAGLNLDPDTGAVSVDPGTPRGTYSLEYRICEKLNNWNCIGAMVYVTMTNTAPVAAADSADTIGDAPVTIDVLGNDSDADHDPLEVSSASPAAAHGAVTCTDSDCTYAPEPGYLGPDSFDYTISDYNGGSASATVSVAVVAPNQPPVARDDSASTRADTAVVIDVLANDGDPDGDLLSIDSPNPTATHGTVTCTAAICTYTPASGYDGADAFSYTVSDGHGHSAGAAVTISIEAAPSPMGQSAPAAGAANISVTNVALLGKEAKRGVLPGQSFRYRIRVKNGGALAAEDVSVCSFLYYRLAYVSAPGAQLTRHRACWTVAALAPGQSLTFSARVRVSEKAGSGFVHSTAVARAKNVRSAVKSVARTKVRR